MGDGCPEDDACVVGDPCPEEAEEPDLDYEEDTATRTFVGEDRLWGKVPEGEPDGGIE